MPPRSAPRPSILRQVLRDLLRTSSDFDAFLIDFFTDTHRRISAGMDRTQRENLLLEREAPEAIWQVLNNELPDELERSLAKHGLDGTTSARNGGPTQPPHPPEVATEERPPHIVCLVDEKDSLYYEQMRTHIASLQHPGRLTLFSPFDVMPGELLEVRVQREISKATLILCLVSPDYLASMQQSAWLDVALHRQKSGQVRILPILARPALLEASLLADLQALPRNGKPISTWRNVDEAWLEVIREIDRTLRLTRSETSQPQSAPYVATQRSDTPIGEIFRLFANPRRSGE